MGCFYVVINSKQGSKVLLEKKMGIVGIGKDRATWGCKLLSNVIMRTFSLKVRRRCHTEKCCPSLIICQELKMVTKVCIFS